MTLTTFVITGANLLVGFFCSFLVFGVTWTDNPPLAKWYLVCGVIVPFIATAAVTRLNLKIEQRWSPALAWVNAFAYTPIYFLLGSVSIGEAIRRSDLLQLIWVFFALTTLLVSAGAGLLVRTLMKESITHTHDVPLSRRFILVTSAVALLLIGFPLLYAVSYIAEDTEAVQRQPPTSSESAVSSTAGDDLDPRFLAGMYRLKTQFRGDGDCLESDPAASPVHGGAARFAVCQNVSSQLWTVVPEGSDRYRLKTQARGDGECLEGNVATSPVHEGAAFLDTCQNVSGQLWKLIPKGSDSYQLKTVFRGDGECLDGNQPASRVHGGAAFMNTCQNIGSQLWKLDTP